ncbi:MAG: O-antigen ligase family protein [Elusimicrobia bacterium]|nr:O-antigen ligase family protein [Elusimicrobiota bacterium]
MAFGDLEEQRTFRLILSVTVGFAICLAFGVVATNFASPLIIALALAVGVGMLTFFKPKIGMGFMVFSMLLSPRLRGGSLSSGGSSMGSAVEIRFDDIILMVVFLGWVARTAVIKGRAFLAGTPVHLPVFMYTSVCVLSTALAVLDGRLDYLRPGFFVLKYVQYFVLFFMTVNIVENEEDIRRYLWMAWITAVIVTMFGFWQLPQGARVSTPFETPISVSMASRTQAQMENEANTYGGYFMVVFGVLFGQFVFGSMKKKQLALGSFMFMLVPFMMTLSRSSYIGLLFMVLFLLAMAPRNKLPILFTVLGAVVLVVMIPQVRSKVFNRFQETFSGAGTSRMAIPQHYRSNLRLEQSAMSRVVATRWIVTDRFPKAPVLGWGVTGVGLVDTQFPRVLGETGLLGLSLFFWMLYRIWQMGHAVFRYGKTDDDRALGLGLMAALIGVVGHAYGANTFIIVRIMEPFWFLTAMVARLYINDRDEMVKIEDYTSPLPPERRPPSRHAHG